MIQNWLKIGTLLIALVASATTLFAQEEENEDYLVIDNKLFSKHSHWLSLGSGYGLYAERMDFQPNFAVDLNLKVKRHYFTLGYLYSGQNYIHESHALQVNDLHIGYGWRKETVKTNRYFFVGPSLAMGYQYAYTDSLGRPWDEGFIDPGIYAEYQFTYKFNYDMGLGLAGFTSLSPSYQVVGIKLLLYLSTAYIDVWNEE